MIEPALAVTNNNMVSENLSGKLQIMYVEGSLMDVLLLVRDHIHKGHRLLTHPLSGSVKPNETPFKTVLISTVNGKTTDMDSLMLIEVSIQTAEKLLRDRKTPVWSDKLRDDFSLIDYDLINNAIN